MRSPQTWLPPSAGCPYPYPPRPRFFSPEENGHVTDEQNVPFVEEFAREFGDYCFSLRREQIFALLRSTNAREWSLHVKTTDERLTRSREENDHIDPEEKRVWIFSGVTGEWIFSRILDKFLQSRKDCSLLTANHSSVLTLNKRAVRFGYGGSNVKLFFDEDDAHAQCNELAEFDAILLHGKQAENIVLLDVTTSSRVLDERKSGEDTLRLSQWRRAFIGKRE